MSAVATLPVDVRLTLAARADSLRADVRTGLTRSPKELPPKWFYDERGSALFDEITRLPEYYLTRAERTILAERAEEIASVSAAETLVELGSGTCEKTRFLLDALRAGGTLRSYVPFDVSESALRDAGRSLAADYPGVDVTGVVGDFELHLRPLPRAGRRLVAFLGGTIGNLAPTSRARFLSTLRQELEAGEGLLLGADLVKDAGRLVHAYDDSAGVTAEFNRNVLSVLNRELGADFVLERFEHVARWDAEREWIEMRLRSDRDQRVGVPALELEVAFAQGEEMRTEISAKFRRAGLERELAGARFDVVRWWTDRDGDFALALAVAR